MSDYHSSPRLSQVAPPGMVVKRRSEVLPGESIVGRVPRYARQFPLYDTDDDYDRPPRGRRDQLIPYDARRGLARRAPLDDDDGYDSEGSVPPLRRRPQRARSQDHRQLQRDQDESSSDLGSSTDDEKTEKKVRRKKYLTFGLTGVALIHAGASIHKAMELNKQREADVATGEMDEDEAHEKKKQTRVQELGAVGLAGLGVWQSWKEIRELREIQHEHEEAVERNEERHRKREDRRKRGLPCRPVEKVRRELQG
ncbi:hypothetical protein K402DRAFT_400453 [Aulographum hederae CBS 113979]|uniref:Uncharacterized protein n=1 Tax=Aulographum hederae CBS 113979 TaxID=1176131 RepID=A0A6G1HCR3_9PEZI|nr:hypothetical protein K402DRAFT_400453 [Aulographum hederae CBS 113979]